MIRVKLSVIANHCDSKAKQSTNEIRESSVNLLTLYESAVKFIDSFFETLILFAF